MVAVASIGLVVSLGAFRIDVGRGSLGEDANELLVVRVVACFFKTGEDGGVVAVCADMGAAYSTDHGW
jgi:hypothetical protein